MVLESKQNRTQATVETEARKTEIQSQARRLGTVMQALGKQEIHKFEGSLGYTVRLFKRDGGGSGVKWSTQQAGEQGRPSARPIDDFRQTDDSPAQGRDLQMLLQSQQKRLKSC